MKLLRWLAGIFIALMLLVWLGGRWLTRDDLATCQAAPSSAEQCQAADAIVAVSGGDTQARTAEAIRLFADEDASAAAERFTYNRIGVERFNRVDVQHGSFDAVGCELLGRFEGERRHNTGCDDAEVFAGTQALRFSDFERCVARSDDRHGFARRTNIHGSL